MGRISANPKKTGKVKYALFATLCGVFTLTGCVDNPAFVDSGNNGGNKIPATENPMPDLNVPDGFNWNTIRTISLQVNANDEYLGEYNYIIDAWDNNPINNAEAHMLSKGTAKKGTPYTTSFSVPAGMTTLFIRQTDPRGRSVVQSCPIPSDQSDIIINCDFASTNTAANKRSFQLKALEEVGELPNYTTIPGGAIEISQQNQNQPPFNALQNGGIYKITGDYTGTFTHNGVASAKLYVGGNWTIKDKKFQIETGLEIIVLSGAKIIANNLIFVGTAQLTIMPGGSVETEDLTLANTNKFYNQGTLKATKIIDNPGFFYNGEKATMNVDDFTPGASQIYNYGIMKFGNVKSGWGSGKWVNHCTVEVEDDFKYEDCQLIQEQGTITATKMHFNNTKILMTNGSMLSASKQIIAGSNTVIDGGTGEARSLLQSPKLNFSSNMTFQGMLTVEADDYDKGNEWWKPYNLIAPAQMAGYKESNITITTCNGDIGNEGNPGDLPENPEWPMTVTDETTYSYAFEDNWPVYGDYDMNDVVIYITKREFSKRENGTIINYKIHGRLMAVGASKKIAAALRITSLEPSDVKNVSLNQKGAPGFDMNFFDVNSANLENGQKMAVIPIFSDAHEFISGSDKPQLINTLSNLPSIQPKDFEIEIEFNENGNITERVLDMICSDLFIITDGKNINRREVHLPEYKPTNRADESLLNTGNCEGSRAPYLSNDGLSFALMIPNAFRWPNEYTPIEKAYEQFAPWVQSSGEQYSNWYENPSNQNVYPSIK